MTLVDKPIIVETGAGAPDSAIIWLHGLGADGHDFEPIVPELRLPDRMNIRFVFPNAPVRPVSINGGMPMRAWYDIYQEGSHFATNVDHVRESAAELEQMMTEQVSAGIAPERIVLAGFSQGGAVALHTTLRTQQPIAGTMALSTYVPARDSADKEFNRDHTGLPVFMAHGTHDTVLPMEWGVRSCSLLRILGLDVEWHEYPMDHSVCPQEIDHISAWLQLRLG